MRLDAQQNRALLLKTAHEMAAAGEPLTLNELARRSGMGVATVYRHFPTATALFATLLQVQLDQFGALMRRANALPDPAEGLRALFLGVLELELEHPMLASLLEASEPVIAAQLTQLQDAARSLVQRARRAKVIRASITSEDVCHLLLGVHAAALRAQDPRTAARKYAQIVLAGLR